MKTYVPSFKYKKSEFNKVFDRIYEEALRVDTVEISGIGFWNSFFAESVDITVKMSKKKKKCPRLADVTVTTMLPVDRDLVETVFWKAISVEMKNMDIPETEMEYHPTCQRSITLKLYNPVVRVVN